MRRFFSSRAAIRLHRDNGFGCGNQFSIAKHNAKFLIRIHSLNVAAK